MQYRPLGTTGIRISAVSFGAGPVPALLTRTDAGDSQHATVQRALDGGINWFDTAATYGDGQSELSLGRALRELSADHAHIATKVRLPADQLGDIRRFIRESVTASLKRLGRTKVSLIQLHNSITAGRGDQPTSITPADVLGPRGVLETFRELRSDGLTDHIGLTGLGDVASLREVVQSEGFETIQTPYHLLNPTAGADFAPAGIEADYGNIIGECARMGMGVLAIRVFAGGALAGQPPSAHTLTTKFFPLAIYECDARRAAAGRRTLTPASAARTGRSLCPQPSQRKFRAHWLFVSRPDRRDPGGLQRGPLDPELVQALDRWLRTQGRK